MAGTYLSFPYDQEIFDYKWSQIKDTVSLALLNSGAMVESEELKNLIANGSNVYTLPFYNVLGGSEDNYDGATDMTFTELTGSSQSGVVYGRMHAFKAKDFIVDFNSGADPMDAIVAQVAKWYDKKEQNRLVGILNAVFGVSGMTSHVKNIALSASGTVADANKVGATTLNDATVDALGDASGEIVLAIMHSKVASNLANLNLLNYRKYTDPSGIERDLNIADWNGRTVIVTDQGTSAENSTTNEIDYTTFLLGRGALLRGIAPVSIPSEKGRDPKTNGGEDLLYTRIRRTIHPNGFTFTLPASTISPTDAQLSTSSNWSLAVSDLKLIPMVKVVSNG